MRTSDVRKEIALSLALVLGLSTRAVAAGDFNGDGYDDLIVGAPYETIGSAVEAGSAFVMYGSATGIATTPASTFILSLIGLTEATGDRLGTSIAVGNFDGDAYDDAAIGVPGREVAGKSRAGMVVVLRGSAVGLTTAGVKVFHQNTKGIKDKVEADAKAQPTQSFEVFGTTMCCGDFDGNGYDDLAIGVIESVKSGKSVALGAGAVHAIYGSKFGLRAKRNQLWHLGSKGIPGDLQSGAGWGLRMTCGDFDGDGADDLVVGSDHYLVDADSEGAFSVIYGKAKKGLHRSRAQWFDEAAIGGPSTGNYTAFTYALAAGDLNGDGRDDLAIGSPGVALNGHPLCGQFYVMTSTPTGLDASATSVWNRTQFFVNGTTQTSLYFGKELVCGDFDDDTFDDLAVGVPGQNSGAISGCGAVQIFPGTANGISALVDTIVDQDTGSIPDTNEVADQFGGTLATGDFDGNGLPDLACGMPFQDISGASSAGALLVLSGSPSGIATNTGWFVHEGSPVIGGAPAASEQFGEVLGK
ncbi:MAG: FG-GAP repeat protein [Planctomycetes bacterium]|nr:FG-GAP repeat protein [Planctomycetota bacterium]